MARGNCIVVSAEPNGRFEEGIIASGQTPKPGTVMQRDPTVALQGGRHTYKIYDRASTGDDFAGSLWVLREDYLQGKANTEAYAAGDRCFLYSPQAGDELNIIVKNLAGTADDHAAGALLSVDDTTGKLVAAAGASSPFQLLEAITDPTADTLAWVQFRG